MRALVWHGPRSMRLESVPEPVPAGGEVVIRVEAVGICGSELSGYLGENSLRKPPLIMGHEFAGRVVQVPAASRLSAGQMVVVNPLVTCGQCSMCRAGLDNLCEERRLVGAARPGAFADLVSVPERNCHLLSAEFDPVLGAIVEPLACAVRAVDLAGIGLGDSVFILGAGAIGLLAVACARRAGATLVAVVDINQSRLETARAWGATHLIDARLDTAAESKRLIHSQGVDAVIDAVGRTSTRQAAVRAVRRGGRVVLLGLHEADSAFPVNDMIRNETMVIGTFAYRTQDFGRAVALLQTGMLPTGSGWCEERPLEAGPDAFAELVGGNVAASKIVLRL